MQTQEDLARLQAALECLPEPLQTTLLLVELEGESCLSVAAALGWPVGTVYWRLHEARKRFQVALRSVDAARAQRRSGVTQPASKERRRALRVPSFGMFTLFGVGSSFESTEAARLLRLGRAQPPANGALESSLARHQLLVKSGAELPAWAASYAPHAVTWFGLVGAGATGAIAAALIVPLAAALVLQATSAPPVRRAAPLMAARSALAPAHSSVLPADLGAAAAQRHSPASSLDSAARPTSLASVVAPASGAASAVEPAPKAASGPALAANRASLGAAARTKSGVMPAASRASSGLVASEGVGRVVAVTNSVRAGGSASLAAHSSSPAGSVASVQAPAVQPASTAPSSKRASSASAAASDAVATAAVSAPRPRVSTDAELQEMRDIGNAERLIATDPARALAMVQADRARFPKGYFVEERSYVEVMALFGMGRLDEARAKAADFLRTYPDGAYSRRVRHVADNGAH
jgi:hypothetical protein